VYVSIGEENNDNDKTSTELQRSLGIRDEPIDTKACDRQTLEEFERNIKFVNDRYEVRLPMRFGSVDLPNNYDLAKKEI
jgi:hypothetical protein